MATLLGQKINATYDSLLKTEDNDGITGSLKQITDGVGQTTPLYLSTTEAKIGGNLEITGDLTVGGTTTYVNTDNVTVKDGLVLLANDNVADIIDIGLYGKYNDGTVKYTGLYRDATDGVFKIFDGLATEPTTTVGGGNLADFAAAGGSFSGNLTLTTGKIFVNGAGNNGYINSKGAVAAQVLSVDDSRLFRGLDSSVQEVFYVQGTGDVFASGQLSIDSIVASGSVSAFNVTASNAITSGTLNVADAIIHTGDTDTMIEFLANQIKTTTGGVLNINTTPTKTTFYQDVGIGASPRGTLDIQGTGLYLGYGSTNVDERDWLISTNYAAYGDFVIRQSNAKDGNPYSAGTTRLTIDSSGNVTIGGGVAGDALRIYNSGYPLVKFMDGTTARGLVGYVFDWGAYSLQSESDLAFRTGASGGTERMRIDSSGNIDINGGNIILRNSTLYAPTSGYLKDGFIANDDGNLEIAINGASNGAYGSMSFITRKGDSSDPIEAMNIDSSGNVLIGTQSSSGFPLEVYGGTGDGVKIKAGNSSNDDSLLITDNSDTTLFKVDGGGNVGINCSPATKFEVSSGNANNIAHFRSTDSVGYISISDNTTSPDLGNYIGSQGNNMFFGTADTERMRITSGGEIEHTTGVVSYKGKKTITLTASNGSGGGIFATQFGSSTPQVGYIYVTETGTSNYAILSAFKADSSSVVLITTIANNNIYAAATNSIGTVALAGFTNSNNVRMKAVIEEC